MNIKVTLDYTDIRPGFSSVHCQDLTYDHFKEAAQAAIDFAGYAIYSTNGGNVSSWIYPKVIVRHGPCISHTIKNEVKYFPIDELSNKARSNV